MTKHFAYLSNIKSATTAKILIKLEPMEVFGWPEMGRFRKIVDFLIGLRQTNLRLGILRVALFFVGRVFLYLSQAFSEDNVYTSNATHGECLATLPHYEPRIRCESGRPPVAMFPLSRPNSRVGVLSRREVPILQDVRWLALIARWVFQEKFHSDFPVRQPASGLNYR